MMKRQRRILSWCLAALLTACGQGGGTSGAGPPPPITTGARSSTAVWLHPQPDCSIYLPPAHCSEDALQLTDGTGAWPIVAARTSVFGIYASWPLGLSNAQLSQMIAFLNAHGMSIEIEAPALQATASCGNNVEGFVPAGQSLHDFTLEYLNILRAGDANVAFVKMDEPFYFGSISTEPNACQWPVATVARDVYSFVQLVHTVYPNAQVGDVEPIVASGYSQDPISAVARWWDQYKVASGTAFPFYVADLDFENPAWPGLATAAEQAAHQRGMQFGIIYNGDSDVPNDAGMSDQTWVQNAIARFQTFQGTYGSKPDFALFQSWQPQPAYALPETGSATFTSVIKAYIDAGY